MSKADELAVDLDYETSKGEPLLYRLAAAELRRLSAINAELLEALKPLAEYPLEEFAMQWKDASRPLFGANEWQLLVGHVKAARAAIAKAQGE